MPLIAVDDISDPRLADYRNVPDPELLRDRGVFVAEGRHVVRRLLTASRFAARSILLTQPAREALGDLLPAIPDIPIFAVSQDAMNAIVGFNIHRGCLAIGERQPLPPWQDLAGQATRLVILEHVSNADNVGAIFRNAAAFGVDAVLLGPSCTDPLYRKAIRTSMGAALMVPFTTLREWPADLGSVRGAGFRILALTPAADAPTVREVVHGSSAPSHVAQGREAPSNTARPFPAADRLALLLGHEGHGLTDAALEAATTRVRIPMTGTVDSLNVATAAALALYELSR